MDQLVQLVLWHMYHRFVFSSCCEYAFLNSAVHVILTLAVVEVQVPWIMSGTLCENVLFGKKYDSKRLALQMSRN